MNGIGFGYDVVIYCDGGCRGNQSNTNIGGYGSVIIEGDQQLELSGARENTTNNQMELKACIEALKMIKGKEKRIKVVSDSRYLITGMNEWVSGWEKNNWKNSKKQPVANQELWLELIKLSRSFSSVSFEKCCGHSNCELNNLADKLVNIAMDKFSHLIRSLL